MLARLFFDGMLSYREVRRTWPLACQSASGAGLFARAFLSIRSKVERGPQPRTAGAPG